MGIFKNKNKQNNLTTLLFTRHTVIFYMLIYNILLNPTKALKIKRFHEPPSVFSRFY